MSKLRTEKSNKLEAVVSEIEPYYSDSSREGSRWANFKDSFKRQVPSDEANGSSGIQMQKSISKRHLRLMALVSVLGYWWQREQN